MQRKSVRHQPMMTVLEIQFKPEPLKWCVIVSSYSTSQEKMWYRVISTIIATHKGQSTSHILQFRLYSTIAL